MRANMDLERSLPIPIVIMLDSSTLRSLNPRGETLSEILRLAREEIIWLRIHELVWKEVTTGLWEEARQLIDKAEKIEKIVNWIADEEKRAAYLKAIETLSGLATNEGAKEIENGFKKMIEGANTEVIELSLKQTREVFESYFIGTIPFSSLKARKDIPDAYIFSGIKQAASNEEIVVHVVCSDNQLRKSCEQLNRVVSHSNIADFLRDPTVIERIRMTSKDVNFDSWRQRFEEMLSKNLFSFWNQIDLEVTSWIKANLSLDYKGAPATLYDLGSVDAHELLSDKASVLSPMSAIIGVNIRTHSSKLMIDRKPVEALTQSFGEAGGINYVDV
jgi:hypothetical protein